MTKAFVVARWEYVEKLKSKAFLIGLFVTPIIMIGMGILPTLFVTKADEHTRLIGVIDMTGELSDRFVDLMENRYRLPDGTPNYHVRVFSTKTTGSLALTIQEADAEISAGRLEGYCVLRSNALADSVVEYRSRSVGDFRTLNRIEENLRTILTERKLEAMGYSPALVQQLKTPLDLRTVKLSTSGEEEEAGFEHVFFSAYVFLMMLFFLIVTSGQLLVRSVIEEKANRIVEVLVSSCSPTDLMAGKILGLSALGFTQIGFWGLIGFALSIKFGVTFAPVGQVVLLGVYFVLGYLFYSAVFIAVGSPLTTEQEAQQINSYLVLILIVPLVLALPAMQQPDAAWIRVLSYIPFLTPTMMTLRIPIQTPPLMEILLTILIMAGAILFSMYAAGKIFRIGILATGKRPSLAEVVRWVRAG